MIKGGKMKNPGNRLFKNPGKLLFKNPGKFILHFGNPPISGPRRDWPSG